MSTSSPINLLNYDFKGLQTFFKEQGEPSFRALQIFKWIHHEGILDFEKMTNLSKVLRQKLTATAEARVPEVVLDRTAKDGTRKWLLRMQDGNCIETVFIPEKNRGTLCVSSQVGCGLNCSFCATARQGFNRNLTTAEIIGQVWIATRHVPVTNVVMMGMGEPLLNMENVVPAMDMMMDDNAYGLSKRRVTLSTSGLVPEIKKLKELSEASLAISLHAPNDALRNELVPLNKKYPLKELMSVCRDYFKIHGKRRITFEYVMLQGVNDTAAHARELLALLQGIAGMVNLIPFNPFPGAPYQRSREEDIQRFQDILMKGGRDTIVRRTRGDDIDAACGQLVGQFKDRTKRSLRFKTKLEESACTTN